MKENLFIKKEFTNQDTVGPSADFYKENIVDTEYNKLEEAVDEHVTQKFDEFEQELRYKPIHEILGKVDSQESIAHGVFRQNETLGFSSKLPLGNKDTLKSFAQKNQINITEVEAEYAELRKKAEIIKNFYNNPEVVLHYQNIREADEEIKKILDSTEIDEVKKEELVAGLRNEKNDIAQSITTMMPDECEEEESIMERMQELDIIQRDLTNFNDSQLQ